MAECPITEKKKNYKNCKICKYHDKEDGCVYYEESGDCGLYESETTPMKEERMTEEEMESRISLISAMLDEDKGYLPFEGRCLASLARFQLIDKLTNKKEQKGNGWRNR